MAVSRIVRCNESGTSLTTAFIGVRQRTRTAHHIGRNHTRPFLCMCYVCMDFVCVREYAVCTGRITSGAADRSAYLHSAEDKKKKIAIILRHTTQHCCGREKMLRYKNVNVTITTNALWRNI